MEILKEFIVNREVERVWEVLGIQFGDACKWASSLSDSNLVNKSPVGIDSMRVCKTSNGVLKEKINVFDEELYILSFSIEEGLPSFVTKGGNTWKLKSNTPNQTKVLMRIELFTSGLRGSFFGPVLKRKMSKQMDQNIEEFIYFTENDKVHPRKLSKG